MKSPKLLIVVASAGVDPWLSIEHQAQESILLSMNGLEADVVWVEASDSASRLWRYKLLDYLFQAQLNLMYAEIPLLRRVVKRLWRRFGFNSLGSRALRRLTDRATSAGAEAVGTNRIRLNLPRQMSLHGPRTVEIFKYALHNYDFDYLLRITSTCLPVASELVKLINGLPRNRVYAGQKLRFAGTDFNSGSSLLFSRDVVQRIVEERHDYRYNVYEDVGLGHLIKQQNLAEMFSMRRIDVTDASQIPLTEVSNWPAVPIVRCKAESPLTTQSKPVVTIMKALVPHLQ